MWCPRCLLLLSKLFLAYRGAQVTILAAVRRPSGSHYVSPESAMELQGLSLCGLFPSRSHHYYPQMSGRHLSMLDLGTGGLEASANCLSATHAGRVRLFRVYYWGYRLETQSPSSLLPSTNGLHDDLSEQDDDRNSRIIGSILRTVQLGLMPNNSLDSGIPNAQHQLMQEPASLRR
jgi:hypothetical protein